jgi:hypothetical protein
MIASVETSWNWINKTHFDSFVLIKNESNFYIGFSFGKKLQCFDNIKNIIDIIWIEANKFTFKPN